MFKIALVAPEIPQNSGSIGRLCVNNDCGLHLVRPLGFSLEDKYLRRAGLDYWEHLDLKTHDDAASFLAIAAVAETYVFTSRASRSIWECPFKPGSFLVFGNESSGLPAVFHERFAARSFKIPMLGRHARTINLANAVAIVLYEGIRKNGTYSVNYVSSQNPY